MPQVIDPSAATPASASDESGEVPGGTPAAAAGRVLLVEDDRLLVRFLQRPLNDAGFRTDTAGSIAEAQAYVARDGSGEPKPDAVLLDLELPDANGLTLLEAMRGRGDLTPVIILTGRGGDETVVRALEMGADDFIEKPVAGVVLLARLRAVLRRGQGPVVERRKAGVLALGPLVLDRLARRANVQGHTLDLTPKEFSLLEYLLLGAEETVTRTELLEYVWELQGDPDSNVVDAHMARLRAKLRAVTRTPEIRTVRGKGFVLTETA